MTVTGPTEMTGALLARKGAATPAGFKAPPARPPPPAGKISRRPGLRTPALWLLSTAAVAVAATLAAQSIMPPDMQEYEIAVTMAAPLEMESEIIEAPDPPSRTTRPAAPALAPPPPPAPPVSTRPRVAAKPVKPIYRVQLHALGSRAQARREWRKIKRSHVDLFGRKKMILLSGKNKTSGIRFVRLQAGPFNGFRDARNLCSQAIKRRLSCVVVRQ